MKDKLAITISGTVALLGLFAFISSQPTSKVEPEIAYDVIDIQPLDTQIAETYLTYSDWTLEIPEIDFNQQMTQITKQGRTLPVPDGQPGYYSENPSNLFIVGHNNSVFPRLSEIPSEIKIYHDGQPTYYHLVRNEVKEVSQIDMDYLLNYSGVVVMTCAGTQQGNNWSHRLILFYT